MTPPLDLSDLIGTPYEALGRSPGEGIDCAGVAVAVLERLKIPPPPLLAEGVWPPVGLSEGATGFGEWIVVGTDPAAARAPGAILFGSNEDGSPHVWISIGRGELATAFRGHGFRVVSLGSLRGRPVTAFEFRGAAR